MQREKVGWKKGTSECKGKKWDRRKNRCMQRELNRYLEERHR